MDSHAELRYAEEASAISRQQTSHLNRGLNVNDDDDAKKKKKIRSKSDRIFDGSSILYAYKF
jgi:hypothetical protein